MKLKPKPFALAFGVTTGAILFLIGLAAGQFGWGTQYVELVGSMFRGFDSTFPGAVIGGVWGFIEGFILGWAIAWLYNHFS